MSISEGKRVLLVGVGSLSASLGRLEGASYVCMRACVCVCVCVCVCMHACMCRCGTLKYQA